MAEAGLFIEGLEGRTLFAGETGVAWSDTEVPDTWVTNRHFQWRYHVSLGVDQDFHVMVDLGDGSAPQWDNGQLAQGTFKEPGTYQMTLTLHTEDGQTYTSAPRPVRVLAEAKIKGTVFSDLNDNGRRDRGENALVGYMVHVDVDGDGPDYVDDITATVGANGYYVARGLFPGTHKVYAEHPSHPSERWDVSTPPRPVTLAAGRTKQVAALGVHQILYVAGSIFHDKNGDGRRQYVADPAVNETFVPGIQVFLDRDGDGVRDRGEPLKVTDAHGNYRFKPVNPGKYRVMLLPPKGWVQTPVGKKAIATVRDLSVGGFASMGVAKVSELRARGIAVPKPAPKAALPAAAVSAAATFGLRPIAGPPDADDDRDDPLLG